MAWQEGDQLKWRWEWAREGVGPILRLVAAILVVGSYVGFGHERLSACALKSTAALFEAWSIRFPMAASMSSNAGMIVYFIHLAIPAGFVLVLLLAIIGNGRTGSVSGSRTAKGLGWVWIAGVVGLVTPFVLSEWLQ
ncbi:MAG: hypothetical protein HQL40_06730 [Alphaproteobacteria bacterium]|nr:hypothetical protein [Alphaproteobacteria bacterium]